MTAIWAHRGASAYAPENTIPALKLALEQGADGVEFDVQRTVDGELVVIHDEAINRTSNGIGRVVDLTLEQLRRCNFSNGFVGYRNVQIPTLREVLDLLAGSAVTINVELKNTFEPYPGLEFDVWRMVEDYGLTDRTIVSSFNHFSLANLRDTVTPANLGLIFTEGLFDPWEYANWFGAESIHPYHLVLRQPHFMWLCHEAGVKVHTWNVDDPAEIRHLASLGVDAVITNFPDRAKEVLAEPR